MPESNMETSSSDAVPLPYSQRLFVQSEEGLAMTILGFRHPMDTLRSLSVGKRSLFSEYGKHEALWEKHLRRDFLELEKTQSPTGKVSELAETPQSTAFSSYGVWFRAAKEISLNPPDRMEDRLPWKIVSCWYRLRRWLKASAPQIDATLQVPGIPLSVAKEKITSELGISPDEISSLVLSFWSVANGQRPADEDDGDEEEGESEYSGMFGGYSAYDHKVSLRLLPLAGPEEPGAPCAVCTPLSWPGAAPSPCP